MSCNGCDDDDAVSEINTQVGTPLNFIPNQYPLASEPMGAIPPCITPVQPSCAPSCGPPANLPVLAPNARFCPPRPPMPYYTQASICPEDNRQIINNLLFTAVLKSVAPFNMPACGGTADVQFQGLRDISIGARLWAINIGYLTVTAFNPNTSVVTLRNDCDNSCGVNAAAGTLIVACTPFIVTDPPCVGGGSPPSNFPFLAAQFTAPANGDCLDITVTNTNGLQVGKPVQIAGGTYLLQAVISSTLITICNNGQGVTPGTVVEFEDADHTLITPVIPVDTNPCTNTTTTAGPLLVCDAGTARPITGTVVGQVPVLQNITTGEVQYETLGIEVVNCDVIVFDFTVDSSNPPSTAYLATVGNSLLFPQFSYVVIAGQTFQVTGNPDATHVLLLPVPVPPGFTTFTGGSSICEAPCCQQLTLRLCGTDDFGQATTFESGGTGIESGPPSTPQTLPQGVGTTVGDFVGTTTSGGIIVTNDTCKNMAVTAIWNGTVFGNLIGGKYDTAFATIEFKLIRTINAVQTSVATLAQHMIAFDNLAHRFDVQRMWVHTVNLAPNTTVSFDGAIQATRIGGMAQYQVIGMNYLIEVIAVAA